MSTTEAGRTIQILSDMNEELASMEGLTDREILHKMLDMILDSNGRDNSAMWVQCFPEFIERRAKQVAYRLRIDVEKTVTYTKL